MVVLAATQLSDATHDCSIRGALTLAFRKIEKDILPGKIINHVTLDTLCLPALAVTYMLSLLHPVSAPPPIATDIVIGEQCR